LDSVLRTKRMRDGSVFTPVPADVATRGRLDTANVLRDVEVRRVLQDGADTSIAGQGRARATHCAAAAPGNGRRSATRRGAPS